MKRNISMIMVESLPIDIWKFIFEYLDRYDRIFLSETCKFFRSIIFPLMLNTSFISLSKKNDHEKFLKYKNHIYNVNIHESYFNDVVKSKFNSIFPNVKHLICYHGYVEISENIIQYEATNFDMLKDKIPETVKILTLIQPKVSKPDKIHFKNLEKLTITAIDCDNHICFSDIGELKISGFLTKNIYFINIKVLKIFSPDDDYDNTNFMNVKTLHLDFNMAGNLNLSYLTEIKHFKISGIVNKTLSLPPQLKSFEYDELTYFDNFKLPESLEYLSMDSSFLKSFPPNLKHVYISTISKNLVLPKSLESIKFGEYVLMDFKLLYTLPNLKQIDYSLCGKNIEIYRGYLDKIILPLQFNGSLNKDYYKEIYQGFVKIK